MVKGKFNLMNMLNDKSKVAEPEDNDVKDVAGTNNDFKVELISVHQLEPSKDNFYSVADIADLKDSIEMVGVQQNLTVRKIAGANKYKVLAGHRRRLASLKLVEEGKQQFELVPCRVETDIDEIKEKILLIYTNSTSRELSDWEKVEQLAQLKPLLKEYKKTHDIPGRVRELLAEALNVSPSQVGRIESINDNLIPEFKEKLKNNDITFSAASALSRELVDVQVAAFKEHKEHGTIKNRDTEKEKSVKKPESVDMDNKIEHYQVVIDGVNGEIYNTLDKAIGAVSKDIKSYIYILKGEGSKTPVYAIKTIMITPNEFKKGNS